MTTMQLPAQLRPEAERYGAELFSGERFVAPKVELIERMDPMHVKRYRDAINIIPPGSRVLDVGCGVGYGSWMMHQAGLKVVGLDTSKAALAYARDHYPGPDFSEEWIGGVDAVVAFDVLEHLKDARAGVTELALYMLRGSLLLASVPTAKVSDILGGKPAHHEHEFTMESFRELVESCGFTTERLEYQRRHLGKRDANGHRMWFNEAGLFGVFRKRGDQ